MKFRRAISCFWDHPFTQLHRTAPKPKDSTQGPPIRIMGVPYYPELFLSSPPNAQPPQSSIGIQKPVGLVFMSFSRVVDHQGQLEIPVVPAEPVTERQPIESRLRGSWRRWWDDLPLRTKGVAVIGIPVLPLLVSALLFAIDARSAGNAQEWVVHTIEVKSQIASVVILIVDAEAGVRGFLLASINESVRRYEDAAAAVETAIQRLAAMTADNPAQGDHLKTLAALMATRP